MCCCQQAGSTAPRRLALPPHAILQRTPVRHMARWLALPSLLLGKPWASIHGSPKIFRRPLQYNQESTMYDNSCELAGHLQLYTVIVIV